MKHLTFPEKFESNYSFPGMERIFRKEPGRAVTSRNESKTGNDDLGNSWRQG